MYIGFGHATPDSLRSEIRARPCRNSRQFGRVLPLHDAAALGAKLLVGSRPVGPRVARGVEVGDLAHGLVGCLDG